MQPGSSAQTGHPIGAFVNYTTSDRETILAKVGLSFVDAATARKNLEEIPGWEFDQTRRQAAEGWNSLLQRVQVEGGTEAERVNFYTSLYRVLASDTFLGWPLSGGVQAVVRPEWAADRLRSTKWTTSRGGFWGPSQAPWIAGVLSRGLRELSI